MIMKKKRVFLNNKLLIVVLLVICGILPCLLIKVNSFMHGSNYLTINNLEDAIYNDCTWTPKGIEIFGPDPYLVISGFDVDLKSVQLVWDKKNDLNSVQLFYDNGTGFCESNSLRVPTQSYGAYTRLDEKNHIYAIRLDFETASNSDIISLNEVRLNAHWLRQLNNKTLALCTLVIVFSLLASWMVMGCKYISEKEGIALAIGGIGAIVSCYGFMGLYGSGFILLFGCTVICLTVFLSQLVYYEDEKKVLLTFVLFVFLILLFEICKIPYNGAPDEGMRYDIVNYILQYHRIPLGEEPELRNEIFGFSYAFTPINAYILDAIFVKIASLFITDFNTLIIIARIPNALLAVGTMLFSYGIACEKLYGRAKWIFMSGIMLLPEMIFIFSYVNCDGIAVFSFAWIVYYMIKAEKKKWQRKECLQLGLGIGICLLSYYNAYGVILTTIVYCVLSVLKDDTINNKWQFLLQRTIWVFIPAFLYAGWWFIRGAIYHNGDLLGLSISREYGELYALDGYKPSQRATPYNKGFSLRYMLFDMKWLEYSFKSFVAVFGFMSIVMPDMYYQVYYGGIIAAIVIGAISLGKKVISRKSTNEKFMIPHMGIYLLFNALISFAISIYYSYFNDFQAQGRYFILVIFPMMYCVSKCLEFRETNTSDNIMKGNLKRIIQLLFTFFFVLMFEYAFVVGIVQQYF